MHIYAGSCSDTDLLTGTSPGPPRNMSLKEALYQSQVAKTLVKTHRKNFRGGGLAMKGFQEISVYHYPKLACVILQFH